jgi:putative transposase
MVNFREGWRGYLWQGRFSSFVVDGDYVLATARYIELNPVRAFLVERPEDYELNRPMRKNRPGPKKNVAQ